MAEIINRKQYISDISLKARDALNDTLDSSHASRTFMEKELDEDLGMELYEMSEPASRSTLMQMKLSDLETLIGTDNDGSVEGLPELIIGMDSIDHSEESAKIIRARNIGIIKKAIENNLETIPVRITWNGPQSIYGLGIWCLTSREDLPEKFRGMDGKSIVAMGEPAVTTENINMNPEEARLIADSVDAIVSVGTMAPRMSATGAGDAAYKWALRSENAGKHIVAMSEQEIFDKAVRYGTDLSYIQTNNKEGLSCNLG